MVGAKQQGAKDKEVNERFTKQAVDHGERSAGGQAGDGASMPRFCPARQPPG
jgi:hypothetical protein